MSDVTSVPRMADTPSVLMDIDVDRDCLYQLEEEMLSDLHEPELLEIFDGGFK